ncbi:hypothetical protein C8Q77DRAFT_1130034 [Trametes polyzona]|nr:hypothetical protein C8Q77DRAFT_1130034 [Trametes polyzona]
MLQPRGGDVDYGDCPTDTARPPVSDEIGSTLSSRSGAMSGPNADCSLQFCIPEPLECRFAVAGRRMVVKGCGSRGRRASCAW